MMLLTGALRLLIPAFGLLLHGSTAVGAEIRWIDPAGGNFDDPLNWEGSQVPGESDTAVFDLPDSYTVTLSSDATLQMVRQVRGALTLELNGYTLTHAHPESTPGSAIIVQEEGSLTVANGVLAPDPMHDFGIIGAPNSQFIDIEFAGPYWHISGVFGDELAVRFSGCKGDFVETYHDQIEIASQGVDQFILHPFHWQSISLERSPGTLSPQALDLTARSTWDSIELLIDAASSLSSESAQFLPLEDPGHIQHRGHLVDVYGSLDIREWSLIGQCRVHAGGQMAFDGIGLGFVYGSHCEFIGEGILEFHSAAQNAELGAINVSAGHLLVDNCAIDAQGLTISPVRTLTSIISEPQVFVRSGGHLRVGSLTMLSVQGDFSGVHWGALHIEAARPHEPFPFEVLGDAVLGGTISIVAADGVTPRIGDRYRVARWGSRTGWFTAFSGRLPHPNGARRFDLHLEANELTAEVVLFGDTNGDQFVDGGDLGDLLGQWGDEAGTADLNEDFVIDAADLGLLLGAWGGRK